MRTPSSSIVRAAATIALVLVAARPATSVAAGDSSKGPAPFFDYVHVEANSGAASGGHAAVCFVEWCFHFQQSEAGTIQLHRETRERLDHLYRVLDNRSLHIRRVPLSPAEAARLQAAFASRHRIESRQFEVLEALRAERQFLETLDTRAHGSKPEQPVNPIRIPGSAYFLADRTGPSAAPPAGAGSSDVIADLARRIRNAYGDESLSARATELENALVRPEYAAYELPALEAGTWPRQPVGLEQRHREVLSALVAVDVLRSGSPLREDGRLVPPHAEFHLDASEVAVLRSFAGRLRDSLVVLFASPRPDWGYAMLVGMARLCALEDSIRLRRLVLLDVHREDAERVGAETVSRHADVLSAVRDERRQDLRRERAAFFAAEQADEIRWSRLETAATLFVDIDGALRRGGTLRVHHGTPVPVKSARRSDLPLPRLSEGQLEASLAQARAREREYAETLKAVHPYDLLRRNCVTELLRTIDAALDDASPVNAGRPAASVAAQRLHEENLLGFIPFVAARAVEQHFAAVRAIERPSHRRLVLARMQRRESPALVHLRESNVLTSQIYESNDEDSAFLFFTEESVTLRPLFGIANLTVGVAASVAGMATLPFDGGSRLRAGLEGALFSFPELVFVNIRKGSFAFAPRGWAASTPSGF